MRTWPYVSFTAHKYLVYRQLRNATPNGPAAAVRKVHPDALCRKNSPGTLFIIALENSTVIGQGASALAAWENARVRTLERGLVE